MDEEGKITVRGVRNESARVYARRLTISDMVTLQQTGEFDLRNAIHEELDRLKEKERPDFCYTGDIPCRSNPATTRSLWKRIMRNMNLVFARPEGWIRNI